MIYHTTIFKKKDITNIYKNYKIYHQNNKKNIFKFPNQIL